VTKALSDGCLHLHDQSGHIGYLCRGSGQKYLARVRWPGHRIYHLLGKPTRSRKVALRRLIEALDTYDYKRGDVLLLAEYYDPVQLFELVRR